MLFHADGRQTLSRRDAASLPPYIQLAGPGAESVGRMSSTIDLQIGIVGNLGALSSHVAFPWIICPSNLLQRFTTYVIKDAT